MTTYRFYVGANNQTGLLDRSSLVEALIDFGVQGFTLLTGAGYWEGQSEPSAIVEVLDGPGFRALALKRHLEVALNQHEVLATATESHVITAAPAVRAA